MKRILIADDHTVVRRGLRDMLQEAFGDIEIGEAKDSQEAADLLMNQSWDIALVDINMPGRGGLDVLSEARRLEIKTPILILSAYPEEEFALRAFKMGAAGYLNKQSAGDELIVAISKVMTGGKYVTASLAEKLASAMGSDLKQLPHEALSGREMEVLRQLAVGKAIKEIAHELKLSEKTISTYRTRLTEKLGLTTNVALTRYALQHGLVE